MGYAPSNKQFEEEYTIEKIETKSGWTSAQPNEDFMFGYPAEMKDFIQSVLESKQPESDLNDVQPRLQ